MKKHIAILLIIVMVLSLAACQQTPDEVVVVQKDTERMIEQAQDETRGITVQQLEIPQGNYTCSMTGAEGRLNIRADAPVTVPSSNIPITRVSAAGFTQEQVTGFFNYLFPNEKPTYCANAEELVIRTKDEIQQRIVFLKKAVAEGAISERTIFVDEEEINQEIARLEEELISAPDTAPEPIIQVSDGTMLPATAGEYSNNTLVREEAILRLDAQLGDILFTVSTPTSPEGEYEAFLSYWDLDSPVYSEANAVVYDENRLPDGAKDKLTRSFADAKKLCDGFFTVGGVQDVILRDVYIVDDERFGDSDGIVAPAENYAYCFNYARQVGGIPVFASTQMTSGGHDYSLPWCYEHMVFYVDNEGLRKIEWRSPTSSGEILSENPGMISFQQAVSIFEKMVLATYEPQAQLDEVLKEIALEVTVDEIEMSLVRIREQNTNGRNGIYTPAWIFYGHRKQTTTSAYEGGDFTATVYDGGSPFPRVGTPVLVINAIDGTIIDLSKGY